LENSRLPRFLDCQVVDGGGDWRKIASVTTRFSESQWVWNRVHSALVRVNEELLERKVAVPV
jgi:hypothetical protein